MFKFNKSIKVQVVQKDKPQITLEGFKWAISGWMVGYCKVEEVIDKGKELGLSMDEIILAILQVDRDTQRGDIHDTNHQS